MQAEFNGARQIATGAVVYVGFPAEANVLLVVKVAFANLHHLLRQVYFPKLPPVIVFTLLAVVKDTGILRTNYIV